MYTRSSTGILSVVVGNEAHPLADLSNLSTPQHDGRRARRVGPQAGGAGGYGKKTSGKKMGAGVLGGTSSVIAARINARLFTPRREKTLVDLFTGGPAVHPELWWTGRPPTPYKEFEYALMN